MEKQDPRWIDRTALSWTPEVPLPGEPRIAAAPEIAPPVPAPRRLPVAAPADHSAFLLSLILGLLQGLALLWLFQSRDLGAWPGSDSYLCTSLTMVMVFAPLLLVQGAGRIPTRLLLLWTAFAAVALAALGFYHRWRVGGTDPGHAGLALLAMVTLFLFIGQSLLLASAREGAAAPSYAAYFDSAWALAVQLLFSAILAALCWVAIGAAYGWLRTHEPRLQPELFTMPLVGLSAAAGARMAGGDFSRLGARALAFVSRLSLPLAILLCLAWIGVVMAGWQPVSLAPCLGLAAFLLLGINASYGGGGVRPRWRRRGEFVAAFILTPLALLGAVALAARVQEYGWTAQRIFAASLVLVLAGYALCYAGAALISLGGGRWMARLEGANLMMAFVALAMIAALVSPFADPLRLSVAVQSFRVESGKVVAQAFDFAWLRRDGLRFGHQALARMTGIKTNPALARGAYLALVAEPMPVQPTPTEIGANIAVRTPGARLPQDLLTQDWRDAGPHTPPCLTNAALSCDAYFLDLDGDGQNEILLVYGNDATWWGGVMKRDASPGRGIWQIAGTVASPPCPGGLTAMRAGQYAPVAPGWRDLMVAGWRLTVSLTGSGKPPVCVK